MHAPSRPDSPTGPAAERLARALAAMPQGLALLDAQGRIEQVNAAFCAITGHEAATVLGVAPRDLLLPHLTPEDRARRPVALANELGLSEEIEVRARGGRAAWLEGSARTLRTSDGAVEGFVLTFTDISAAREARRRTDIAAAAMRSAAQLAGLGGWEMDFRTREVRYTPELQSLLDHAARAEGFDDAIQIYRPEHRGRIFEALIQTAGSGARMDFEAEVETRLGRRLWLRVMGEAEIVDGVCVAIRGASQDVTHARQAVAGLRESERFARSILDGIAAMVVVVDAEGRLLEANRNFRAAAAARRAARRGLETYPFDRNLFEILRELPEPHGRLLERGIRAVLEGRMDTFARAYEAWDGEWLRMSVSRFQGEGPVRAVLFFQSIVDLKRSEKRLRALNRRLKAARDQADAANVAKSAFLATMSHEIRTPLNGVLGMAQAMSRDDLPPVQRERLAVIRQAGETLLTLLNDLLDLSRIEAGRLELEDGVVDLARLAEGVQATFAPLAAEKDIAFELDIAPAAQGAWRGDPTRVRQILYNLISNAVKFTAQGQVRVAVTRQGGHIVMSVADTGPGVPPDRLGALFEKFVQADATTTRKFGGSGLGLAICRELCHLMGGAIGVESRLGEGSVFTVKLPLRPAGQARTRTDVRSREAWAPAAGRPLRILAAEDNPMNQLVLKTLLAPMPVDLHMVDDGAEAVAAWQDAAWDVVLMDVQMPCMDGPTATRLIRAREVAEGRPRTPIIALTANAMSHHEQEYLDAGMDALTPKPIELERLVAALDAVLPAAEAVKE